MSNLLKEAFIDAKALREAALKNAESAVIDKYSAEVKQTLEQLLEQEELAATEPTDSPGAATDLGATDLGAAAADLGATDGAGEDLSAGAAEVSGDEIIPDIPLAATDGLSTADGVGLRDAPNQGQKVEFNVDLGALQEAVNALEAELSEAADSDEIELTEEDLAEILSEKDEDTGCAAKDLDEADAGNAPGSPEDPGSFAGEEADEEEEENNSAAALAGSAAATNSVDAAQRGAFQEGEVPDIDALTDAIVEKLTVDMGASLSGWAGRSDASMRWQIEKELAARRSTDMQDDLKTLKKAQEELVFENNHLNENLSQHKQAIVQLKESLQDVNLSNARLLYTNRVLRNTSLNERQKDRIVEAISKAGSVAEARTIFDTLQSTVEAKPKRSPQSLSEAITNRSSVIRATRKESTLSDPLQERMKRLAGIK